MSRIIHAWEAARVVRKHTMINIRAENIAEHTWGVVHILLCVWPTVPARVIKGAQYHDIGEFRTGDIPAHIKWANDHMRELTDKLASDGARECLPEHLHECLDISEWEGLLIEICDRAEFCFSTYYEILMGNRHVRKPFYRSFEKVRGLIEKLSEFSSELPEEILPNMQTLMCQLEDLEKEL